MKIVDVKQQVKLPMSRCVELVLNGIRFRLFRAAITVIIISLAVAFLTNMLTESLVARSVAESVQEQIAPRRLLSFWVSRLSVPIDSDELTSQLIDAGTNSTRRAEFKIWGKLSDAELDRLQATAAAEKLYLDFFDDLEEGDRAALVGIVNGIDIFQLLQSSEAMADYKKKNRQKSMQMPTEMEQFEVFLADWSALQPLRGRISSGHSSALAAARPLLKDAGPTEALAEADEAMIDSLGELGFRMTSDEFKLVKQQAALSRDAARIFHSLSMPTLKQRLGGKVGMEVGSITPQVFFSHLSSRSGAKWFVDQFTELKDGLTQALTAQSEGKQLDTAQKLLLSYSRMIRQFDYDVKRIRQVADNRLTNNRLDEVETMVTGTAIGAGFLGFSPRTLWLITVSFIVCIVGITNAMLMSVTERFREIATMKCLGATDGFIMINFVLESCMQGVAGGIIGAVLGLLLGTLRASIGYGWIAIESYPTEPVITVAAVSMLAGVIISAMAAVYPAWVAARLAPMEAMRIE